VNNALNIIELYNFELRAALHLEAKPIYCVRVQESSLVIGQSPEISPNPFTPRDWANLVE